MDNELEVISFERVLTPSLVVDDIYYPDNEYSKKKECALKEQIASIAAEMEPWEVEVARRYAYGETVNALIKSLKKNSAKITACLNTHKTQEIIALPARAKRGPTQKYAMANCHRQRKNRPQRSDQSHCGNEPHGSREERQNAPQHRNYY